MKPKALKNYVILHRLNEQSDTSIFADPTLVETRWCEVADVGPGLANLNEELVPVNMAPNDIVYFMNKGIHDVDLNLYGVESKFSVASELDGLCKLVDSDPDLPVIQPLGDWVEVERISHNTLLKIPDKATVSNIGIVRSVGPGLKSMLGGNIPIQIKVGDKVVFNPFNTVLVNFYHLGKDSKTILVSEGNIMAVLN